LKAGRGREEECTVRNVKWLIGRKGIWKCEMVVVSMKGIVCDATAKATTTTTTTPARTTTTRKETNGSRGDKVG